MIKSANQILGPDALELNYGREVERIGKRIREILSKNLLRRGLVVAMSGGIDSSLSAALSVRAIGAERVFGGEGEMWHSPQPRMPPVPRMCSPWSKRSVVCLASRWHSWQ